jgi:hypothetical protein
VGDTGVLMNEVIQGLRQEHLTGLLAALHHDAARLYVATHVLVEMERDLSQYAAGRGKDAELAMERWHAMYLPSTVVVEVPDTWGTGDERVTSVANRHPVDLPTARLAAALAPCHALIQDPDLTANGFGDKDWLPLTLASANQAEMELFAEAGWIPSKLTVELAKSAGRAFSKLPDWARVLVLLAGAKGLYLWQRNDVAKRHLQRMGDLATKAIEIIGPPVSQVFERYTEAQATWETNVVESGPERTLSERLARLLARADKPMTATELSKLVKLPGTQRDRGDLIRAELRGCHAFVETSRGRWRLGQPASTAMSTIDHNDVAEWIRQAHRSKRR